MVASCTEHNDASIHYLGDQYGKSRSFIVQSMQKFNWKHWTVENCWQSLGLEMSVPIWMRDVAQGILRYYDSHCTMSSFNKVCLLRDTDSLRYQAKTKIKTQRTGTNSTIQSIVHKMLLCIVDKLPTAFAGIHVHYILSIVMQETPSCFPKRAWTIIGRVHSATSLVQMAWV